MVWLELFIIGGAAFAAAGLTFFSGFGLGTLLMPVLAVFFSVELAIMMTAVVHLLNNLFKLALLGRYARTWGWWSISGFPRSWLPWGEPDFSPGFPM